MMSLVEEKPLSKESIKKNRENEKGMSLIETIPLILVMATLLTFLLGFWGVTHRHVLHSIAARAYAFETFRHRANVTYFVDQGFDTSKIFYNRTQHRYHAIRGVDNGDSFIAASIPIRFPTSTNENNRVAVHTDDIWDPAKLPENGRSQVSASPVWIMVGYGICLTAGCGE